MSDNTQLAAEFNLGAQDKCMASELGRVKSCLLLSATALLCKFLWEKKKKKKCSQQRATSVTQRYSIVRKPICNFVVYKFKHCLYVLTPRIASDIQRPRVKEY